MSISSEETEISEIVDRLLDNLGKSITSTSGLLGAAARHQLGIVRANFMQQLVNETFADELLDCFTKTRDAGAGLIALSNVHDGLLAEIPEGEIASQIVESALVFCLASESRIIVKITFTSRDDVDVMMKKMKVVFDAAREKSADAMASGSYQTLTLLAGALTQHLATVACPLPRLINFSMPYSFPALTVSNRIYYDASRWDELVKENKTVHPAFMQRQLRGMSA